MNETMLWLMGLVVVGATLFAGGFVLLSIVPLLARLQRATGEAERLLAQLGSTLPALVKQTTRTLEHLDGTLVETLPSLIKGTTGTLRNVDGSLSTELPGLMRETTALVRDLRDLKARPEASA